MKGHNLHEEAFPILISTRGNISSKQKVAITISYSNHRKRNESFVHIPTSSDLQTCDHSCREIQYLMQHTPAIGNAQELLQSHFIILHIY
jgi:hypothetical protein